MKQSPGNKQTGRALIESGPRPSAESGMMTAPEVARYLGFDVTTVYRMAQARELPALRLGITWRFRRADIEEWIAAGGATPHGGPKGHGRG